MVRNLHRGPLGFECFGEKIGMRRFPKRELGPKKSDGEGPW